VTSCGRQKEKNVTAEGEKVTDKPTTTHYLSTGNSLYFMGMDPLPVLWEPIYRFILCFPLWLYSPIRALAASMKLSVSFQLIDLGQSVGHLGRVISSSQGLSTCTQTQKNAHTTQTLNIHALSGIRTHCPGGRASEDSSCLRPLGYCDRSGSYFPHTNNFHFP
jgi:hypothetical protein